ncbi:Iron-containing alcohol dehydrogenase [Candidatus Hepatincolaceae symbiont of Richtersius coronifer]
MQSFYWKCPTEIHFGPNKIQELGKLLSKQKVNKILFLYGHSSIKKNGIYDNILKQLKQLNIAFVELSGVDPNPRYETVLQGAKICKEQEIDFILAVGGGSVVDCAKAISLASNYSGDFWEEIIKAGGGLHIPEEKTISLGVILTLAATGSEMNAGAVISNLATKEKLSVFSSFVIPKFSILDPLYTYSVPKHQIAAGIADAFSHCLEQYFSDNDNAYISDGILVGIMKGLKEIAPKAINEPQDYVSHANLMWGATMALNGISGVGKNGDWSTHIIEHAVSAYYDITHAVGLAIIFPNWMEYVLEANNAYRFKNLGNLFNIPFQGDNLKDAQTTIKKVREFFNSLNMPSKLSEVGVQQQDMEGIVTSTFARQGMEKIGSFKSLNKDDVRNILVKSF